MSLTETSEQKAGSIFTRNWLLLAFLALAALAVYAASLSNGFMVFDDDKAIRYNNVIKNPTFQGIFFSNNLGMYAPVTWLGYALTYALAGEKAWAFHTFSLLLHIGCVWSVYFLIRNIMQQRETAFFTALLFAVHPMQAEAVSWIAGQSALSFSLFYLLSILAYTRRQTKHNRWWYGLSLVSFILAVLAKSAAVTLPLLLLLLDWYRKGRLAGKDFLDKIPYFLVSIAFGLYTFSTRAAEGHNLVVSSQAYNLFDRFLMVCHSLLFYPVKLLAPLRLSIFYPMEKSGGAWSPDYYAAPLALASLAWLIWKYGRRDRVLGLGAGWYVLPLLVMLPYVSVGTFEMRSDRYVYISSIGIFLLMVWAIGSLPAMYRRIILLLLTAAYAYLGFQRSLVWQNEVSVFKNCVEKYPDAPLCNCNLAYGELLNFDFENSIRHYSKTLQLDPSYVEAYNGRGQAYFQLKKFPEAFYDFDMAIRAGIVTPKLFLNRGKCHVILNRAAEAIPDLARSIQLEPRNPETYYFKAVAENKTGDNAAAIQDYGKAISLSPQYVEARVNRGLLYFNEQRYDEAIADYSAALAANPNVFMALNNRAAAYLAKKMPEKALGDVNKALQLQPNYINALETRAKIFLMIGSPAEAAADLEKIKALKK